MHVCHDAAPGMKKVAGGGGGGLRHFFCFLKISIRVTVYITNLSDKQAKNNKNNPEPKGGTP